MKYYSLNCDNKITEKFSSIAPIIEYGLVEGSESSSNSQNSNQSDITLEQNDDMIIDFKQAENGMVNTHIDPTKQIDPRTQMVIGPTKSKIFYDYGMAIGEATIQKLMQKCDLSQNDAEILVKEVINDKESIPMDCFLEGTEITMYDGIKKNIKLLNVGDIVTSFNLLGQINASRISKIYEKQVNGYYIISTTNSQIKVTSEHPIYIGNGKFQLVRNLKIGDEIKRNYENEILNEKVTNVSFINEQANVYNMHVENDNTYFANDIAVHNKSNTITVLTLQENKRYNEIEILIAPYIDLSNYDKDCIINTLLEFDEELDNFDVNNLTENEIKDKVGNNNSNETTSEKPKDNFKKLDSNIANLSANDLFIECDRNLESQKKDIAKLMGSFNYVSKENNILKMVSLSLIVFAVILLTIVIFLLISKK